MAQEDTAGRNWVRDLLESPQEESMRGTIGVGAGRILLWTYLRTTLPRHPQGQHPMNTKQVTRERLLWTSTNLKVYQAKS